MTTFADGESAASVRTKINAAITITDGLGNMSVQNANAVAITGGTISGITDLAPADGGTGISSYTIGDILFASAAGVLSKLSDIATGNALISGGVGVAPSYGKIGLTTHVSGTLAAGNGGTGIASYTIGAIPYASAAGVLSQLLDVATGNALISGGVGVAPSYGKIGLTTHVSGTLGAGNGGTGIASYTVGSILFASAVGAVSQLADVAVGNVLLSGGVGVAPAYGKVDLTTHISGVLGAANGGTGAATLTGYVKGAGTGAMTASATIPNTDISGLGTLSTQAASAVAVTGGSINGTTIGATTAASVKGSSLTSESVITDGYITHANGTLALGFNTDGVCKVTPTATGTFTTVVPPAGTRGTLIVLTSGTTSFTMTFGTGFKTVGTLATGTVTARYFIFEFISDGTNMIESSRTVAIA